MTDFNKMVSIIITTMNRSDFLFRLLKYYSGQGFSGWLYIGDSSGAEHTDNAKTIIGSMGDKLNIVYREYPGLNTSQCFVKLTQLVKTPYIAYLGDDDFLVPRAVTDAIRFLEENAGYIAAHGKALVFKLKESGPYGHFKSLSFYTQRAIEEETAVKRLDNHLRNYSVTLFSVHRLWVWNKMFRDALKISDNVFAGEMLPCCLSAVYGKIKQLDCLYLLRQCHDRRYEGAGFYDWSSSRDWPSSYQKFNNYLSEALIEVDGINLTEANQIVGDAFSAYFNSGLPEKPASFIKNANPKLFEFLSKFRPHIFNSGISVKSLVRSSCAYSVDFLPVYQLITHS